MRTRLIIATTCLGLVWGVIGAASAQAETTRATSPLSGDVVREFDPPEQNWLPGHRGVDLSGSPGQLVVAPLDARVVFAGLVATRSVITLDHGDFTTTYEPVTPSVSVGDQVTAGQPIGTLESGHLLCQAEACLHWGMRRDDTYLDPLSLLGGAPVRLIAASELNRLKDQAATLARASLVNRLTGEVSPAELVNPAQGSISSAFGLRLHPIDAVWRFHDGLDIAADCGSPIWATAAGTVIEVSSDSGYGNRLVIDHGLIGGRNLQTGYAHALGYTVAVGGHINQGQVIGHVGSTGTSTGCHLHFQTWVDDELTDPADLLP